MSAPLTPTEAKELLRLCESGKLYEIDAWIRAGRSLTVPHEIRKTPLGVAISTGFHSLVELLLRNEQSQEAKNGALRLAIQLHRPVFVELAVVCGADTRSVPFLDVLMTGDRALASFFLERRADPLTDYPFARAFHQLRAKTTLGTYLDCKRQRPELAATLQEQADMALREFCRDGNLKWVSLLMWAGANPRSQGPRLEYIDDPEMHTTALHEACTWGHTDILKRLKPDSELDDLGKLLEEAAFFARQETMAYLLSLGASPNERSGGGSKALEACIRHLSWEDSDRVLYRYGPNYQTPGYKVTRTRGAIRLLIEHGAVWNPDASSFNDVRRLLYKIEPQVTVELVGLLAGHNACDNALLHEFLRKPRMQEHLASCERQMARAGLTLDGRRKAEVKETRRHEPSPYVLASYDREKLYREVWAEPTRKVAARYGISDVALAKACRQLQVPKPPRGYWAKRAAGQPLRRRPKLLPLKT
jgi:hypothetical protein